MHTRLLRILTLVSLLAVTALPGVGRSVHAADSSTARPATALIVTSLADPGDGVCDASCTLRDAVDQANQNPNPDAISFAVSGMIALTATLPLSTAIEISAPRGSIVLDGRNEVRLVNVAAGATVRIDGLGLTNGRPVIHNECGCTILSGGAIANLGNLTLDHVEVYSNTASYAAGILSEDGQLTLRNSIVRDNVLSGAYYIPALGYSVGVVNQNGTLVVENSTITRNTHFNGGNGIDSNGPTLIVQSTIAYNHGTEVRLTAPEMPAPQIIRHSTLLSDGWAALAMNGPVEISHSAVALVPGWNWDAIDTLAKGQINSAGYNAIGTIGSSLNPHPADVVPGPGDLLNLTNLRLGPLTDNGGGVATMLPQPGSPLIDAGDPAFVAPPATDQRGAPRVQGGRIDIGATESPQASVFMSPIEVVEGTTSATQVALIVQLSEPLTASTSIVVATLDDTASAGSDYLPLTTTITFAPGQITQTLLLTILPDAIMEPAERVLVTLTPAAGGTAYAPGVVTILDADTPVLTLEAPVGLESDGMITLTATLDRPAPVTATVDLFVQDGSAHYGLPNGDFFNLSTNQLVFAPGTTTQIVTIELNNDAIAEPTETLWLYLFNAHQLRLTTSRVAVTILDDDTPPRFSIFVPMLRR